MPGTPAQMLWWANRLSGNPPPPSPGMNPTVLQALNEMGSALPSPPSGDPEAMRASNNITWWKTYPEVQGPLSNGTSVDPGAESSNAKGLCRILRALTAFRSSATAGAPAWSIIANELENDTPVSMREGSTDPGFQLDPDVNEARYAYYDFRKDMNLVPVGVKKHPGAAVGKSYATGSPGAEGKRKRGKQYSK